MEHKNTIEISDQTLVSTAGWLHSFLHLSKSFFIHPFTTVKRQCAEAAAFVVIPPASSAPRSRRRRRAARRRSTSCVDFREPCRRPLVVEEEKVIGGKVTMNAQVIKRVIRNYQ
jgi:hypothetical protein